MSEPSEIRVNLILRDCQLADFMAIKEYLGIHTNADVVRYLVHRHARALRGWQKAGAPRIRFSEGERGSGSEDVRRSSPREGHVRAEQGASEFLCLACPLPECDEGDPRCPYQQVAGEVERKRARNREYMRRVRAKVGAA